MTTKAEREARTARSKCRNQRRSLMSNGQATRTADKPAESYSHPVWCDLTECTWSDRGGAHHSAWMTLGPLAVTNFVARAYLYFAIGLPAPMAMVSFHYPVE